MLPTLYPPKYYFTYAAKTIKFRLIFFGRFSDEMYYGHWAIISSESVIELAELCAALTADRVQSRNCLRELLVVPQKIKSAFFFVSVFAFIILFHSHCDAWQGTLVGVPDGDLCLVSHGNQTDRVKLYGIECPRRGQPFWQQSRALASHLALQKIVEVTPLYLGHDGLENALVRIEGTKDYLNLQLISYGLAWVKPKECSAHICAEWRAMESLAQSKAIGLWIDPSPIPPWEWEKEQRHKIHDRLQNQEKNSE